MIQETAAGDHGISPKIGGMARREGIRGGNAPLIAGGTPSVPAMQRRVECRWATTSNRIDTDEPFK